MTGGGKIGNELTGRRIILADYKEYHNEDVLRSIFLVGNQNVVEENGENVLPRKCQKNIAEKISLH